MNAASQLSHIDRAARDVVVVGNGAVGLFLGLELARRGVAVMVVGESGRRFGASVAAGAMLGCYGEIGPSTFDTPFGRAKFELDRLATQRWPKILDLLADFSGERSGSGFLTATGTLLIHNTIGHPQIDDDAMLCIRGALEAHAEPFEDVDAADSEWLDPQPTARPLRALYLPNEHAIDPVRVLKALESALVRAGGELVDAIVRAVTPERGAAVSVQLQDGTLISAHTVVLAAGVQTQALLDDLPELARSIPRLVSGPGIAAVLNEPKPITGLSCVVRTPNRAFACGLHAVPRAQGRVYVGATNAIRPTPTDVPSVRGLQFLLDCAVRQLHRGLWLSDIESVLVGNRPVTLDGYPLFGPTAVEGLWLLTGTYRDGFHTAPVLAELIADWLSGEDPPEPLRLFQPVRRPIQALTRDETVRQTVVHRLATGHEFDWSLPVDWPMIMEGMFANYYAELAGSIDDEYTPPPEILSFMPRYPELSQFLRSFYSASRTGH
jgi:glycine oxidase